VKDRSKNMAIVLKPETEEKLRQTAQREGQDVDILADALLAEVLAQREREFTEDVAAVQEAWTAVREGRERPFAEFMADHRRRFPDPTLGTADAP
jgi:hypothetical protein